MLTEHMKQISKEKENIECQFIQNSFAPINVLNQNPCDDNEDITLKNRGRSDSFEENDNSIVSVGYQQNQGISGDRYKES